MQEQNATKTLPSPPRIILEEAQFYRELLDNKGERACIAAGLKAFRERNALSQRNAAAALGVDRTSWSAWENSARDMQAETKNLMLRSGKIHPCHLGIRFFYAAR